MSVRIRRKSMRFCCTDRCSSGFSNSAKHYGLFSLRYHASGNAKRSIHVWHDVLLSRYEDDKSFVFRRELIRRRAIVAVAIDEC
jgi:hypothetical protein